MLIPTVQSLVFQTEIPVFLMTFSISAKNSDINSKFQRKTCGYVLELKLKTSSRLNQFNSVNIHDVIIVFVLDVENSEGGDIYYDI